jgi:hypothetical protein
LDSYVLTAASGNTRATDDTKRTAYANLRRDFFGRVPFSLRAGLDFREAIRDQRASTPAFTYLGRDGVASTAPSAASSATSPKNMRYPFRSRAVICAITDTAISAGLFAPISRPTGA